MSGTPSGSASSSATPKGIGSLAKKQNDVTRQGTQKLKFTPTLPVRRKKDEAKIESSAPAIPEPPNAQTRNRGRGRGGADSAKGRGRGRGSVTLPIEMTASGPFAMGPALAGSQVRRSANRADFMPAAPTSAATSSALGDNLTRTAAPSLKGLDKGKGKVKVEEEVYSDPDEGVEIIDMNKIKDMDWMAPETLQNEGKYDKLKERESDAVDSKNALDLSESEDDEELEDLTEDFVVRDDIDTDPASREDHLYFFQFPAPFPKFTKPSLGRSLFEPVIEQTSVDSPTKKVSFAPDTKPALSPSSSRPSTAPPEHTVEEPVDGVIGQLEVYKSGAVKIRLINDILLDVHEGTQPSFLQQAVHLDVNEKRLAVLGRVNRQFVVSPDIDSLLDAMELKQQSPVPINIEGADELLVLDTA